MARESALRLLIGRERSASLLMLLLACCNQANGSSTLLNYGAEMLSSPPFTGISPTLAGLLSTLAACVKLGCVTVSLVLVDRIGRRPLLLVGGLCTCVSLAVGAYACTIKPSPPTPIVVASLVTFVGAYALSLAPIFFTLLGEIFSPRVRPLAASLATATTFAAGGVADMTFLSLRDAVGYGGLFGLYSAVCLLGALAVLILLPETKGRPLEEVHALFAQRRCCDCGGGGGRAPTRRPFEAWLSALRGGKWWGAQPPPGAHDRPPPSAPLSATSATAPARGAPGLGLSSPWGSGELSEALAPSAGDALAGGVAGGSSCGEEPRRLSDGGGSDGGLGRPTLPSEADVDDAPDLLRKRSSAFVIAI